MVAPNQAPVVVGEILAAKFRVERILGAGGMGVVVAATHLQLGQLVALKFLLPGALANAAALGRFQREARAAVRLRSEHVARVIDVGQLESSAPYIVMEYLEGIDLGELVEREGPLTITDAVDYVLQACEAVAEAHSLGIVHRDLKPANLFRARRVDGKPLIKVLDFGISKMAAAEGDLSLTKTTDVVGSPSYMSPEQLRSATLADARSDVWALGAILYELLSGKVPFEADTITQLCAMVLSDPPRPLGALRPEVPRGLVEVIERCLEKDPAKRFQGVGDFALALEEFNEVALPTRARRVFAVAAGSGHTLPAELSSSTKIAVAGSGSSTSAAWANTEVFDGAKGRRRVVVPLAAGALALLAAAGAYTLSRGGAKPAAVEIAPSASPPPPVAVGTAPPSSAIATSSALPSRAPPASAPPPVSTPRPLRPAAPRPRPSASPSDDLPNDRH